MPVSPALVVPFVGAAAQLTRLLDQPLTLRLFSNNVVPSKTTRLSDLVEFAGHGYHAKVVSLADWEIILGEGPTPTTARTVQEQSWTFNQAGPASKLYGYYVTDLLGNLLWLERFYEPGQNVDYVPVINVGDQVAFVPVYSYGQLEK